MDKTKTAQQDKPVAQPTQPQGTVPIAGIKVPVGSDTVDSTPGSSQEEIIKGLEKASDEEIFTPSPSPEPPEENPNGH